MHNPHRRRALALLAVAPAACVAPAVRAHGGASEASAASLLSLGVAVAASVTAPVMIFAGGAMLTVVSVEASVRGTVWVLERASDGVRASVEFSGEALEAASVAVGTTLAVTALSAGWLLSAAGEAVCFIPNALGEALVYNERLTR